MMAHQLKGYVHGVRADTSCLLLGISEKGKTQDYVVEIRVYMDNDTAAHERLTERLNTTSEWQ